MVEVPVLKLEGAIAPALQVGMEAVLVLNLEEEVILVLNLVHLILVGVVN